MKSLPAAVHFGELELHGAKNTLRFAAMRLAPWVVAALRLSRIYRLVFATATSIMRPASRGRRIPCSAISIPPARIERGEFLLRPRAEFSATVRILHREDYSIGPLAKLVPTDFAVGWGPMSDSAVLADIEISQGNRFYFWRTENWPIAARGDRGTLGELALIPENRGRACRCSGTCVLAAWSSCAASWWTSKAGRLACAPRCRARDTGAGACEILLAASARVVEP